ncbi:MAG: hypothetical protein WCI01_12470, partial [Chlorobiaceae bacterium]
MSDKYKDIFFLCNFLMRFSVNFFHNAREVVVDGGIIANTSFRPRTGMQARELQTWVVKSRAANSSLNRRLLTRQVNTIHSTSPT